MRTLIPIWVALILLLIMNWQNHSSINKLQHHTANIDMQLVNSIQTQNKVILDMLQRERFGVTLNSKTE